jgi:hypothetical protein
LRLTLPFVARYWDIGKPFDIENEGIVFSVLESIDVFWLLFTVYLFVLVGLVDF